MYQTFHLFQFWQPPPLLLPWLWDGWDSPTPSEEKISCSPLCFWNCGGPDLVPQIWVLSLRSDQPLWRIFGFPYGMHWIPMKASCGGDNNGNKLQLDVDHGLSTHLHKRIDRFPNRGCFSAALCILFSISVNFETDESFVLFGLRMFFYFLKVQKKLTALPTHYDCWMSI